MRAGLASLIVPMVAALVAFSAPALAQPNDGQQLANINQRLSALIAEPASDLPKAPHFVTSPTLEATVQHPGVSPVPAFLTRPQVMHMIAQFRTVDRVMHYHVGGLDANFWGVFNRGRGLSIRFSRSF